MKKKRKYVIIFTIILAFLITFCFLGPHIIGRIYEGVPVIGTYMNTKNGNHMIFIDEKIYFISPKSEKPMFIIPEAVKSAQSSRMSIRSIAHSRFAETRAVSSK